VANPEWIEIFRSYTPEELSAHVQKLKGQISVFTAQQIGSKSYTKDLNELRGQLAAAVRVRNERGASTVSNPFVGVVDFSGINR
jgi:hypothetical protein